MSLLVPNHHPINRDGLVLWLSSRNSGAVAASGTWTDYSGQTNNAALNGNAYVGRSGVYLDGTGDYAVVTHNATISAGATQSITIGCWMRSNGLSNNNPRIWSKNPNYYNYKTTGVNSSDFVTYDGTHAGLVSITGLWDSAWHYVVLVIDRTAQKMYGYRDGNVVDTDADISDVGDATTTRDLYIGCRPDNQQNAFRGWLDDVYIMRRAQPAAEIKQYYERTRRA